MKLYFTVIGVAMALVAALNALTGLASPLYAIIATVWCTALQFALDALIALIIHALPNSRFSADDPRFAVSEREKALYKRLRVRAWKDKVWELGGLGGFSKSSFASPSDPAYVERFIVESNKGVVTHRLSYPIGFLAMLTLPNICAFTIALPVALVNLFLNVLPTLVLRYNTPKLQAVLMRLRRRG